VASDFSHVAVTSSSVAGAPFSLNDCQCVTPYRKRMGASLIPFLQKQQIVSHLILTPSLS